MFELNCASYYSYAKKNSRLKLFEQGSDFDKLRSVREKFRTNYPLSGDLWIQWTKGCIYALHLLFTKILLVCISEVG